MKEPEISLVIPVHNEEKIITQSLDEIISYLEGIGRAFEIVIVENGSADRTLELAREYEAGDERVRALTINAKSLGDALKEGFLKARGGILVWYPIDLSINLDYIEKSVDMMGDLDIVVGSKEHKDSIETRPFSRRMYSKFYNSLVNILFRLGISDTQCVKTLRRDAILDLAKESTSGGIVFEVELLYRAKKKKLRIREVPVVVKDLRSDSKINVGVIKNAIVNLITLRFRV